MQGTTYLLRQFHQHRRRRTHDEPCALLLGTYAPPVVCSFHFVSFRFSFLPSFVSFVPFVHSYPTAFATLFSFSFPCSFRTRPRSHSRPRSFVPILVLVRSYPSSFESCVCVESYVPVAHPLLLSIRSQPIRSCHIPFLSFLLTPHLTTLR